MLMMPRRMRARCDIRKRKSLGVSLLEVLISILLAAIGLLALAGANVASIRYSKMAQYRGTATLLAADFAERMRANKAGLAGYAEGSDFAAQAAAIGADTSCDTYAATCNANGLASYDKANWRHIVRNQLPEGSVFVVVQAAQVAADVWIAWRDPAVTNTGENSTDARNAALECPNGLNLGTDKSIRCSYFRINL
jgi:type IV pilus assembly protein PilV